MAAIESDVRVTLRFYGEFLNELIKIYVIRVQALATRTPALVHETLSLFYRSIDFKMEEAIELSDQEQRYLRAITLHYEAIGRSDLADVINEAPPHFQRSIIRLRHLELESPEEFRRSWRWAVRLLPVMRLWTKVRMYFRGGP